MAPLFTEMPVEPSDPDIAAAPESVQDYLHAMQEVNERQERMISLLMEMDVYPDLLSKLDAIASAPLGADAETDPDDEPG